LEIARDNDVNEIAFPAISTGAYRFPGELAAEIATRTVAIFLKQSEPPKKVIFCCFGADSLKHHQIALANL
jgi:O-acetyl-ADP-ribose deacetylase (regulator of RNase III)